MHEIHPTPLDEVVMTPIKVSKSWEQTNAHIN